MPVMTQYVVERDGFEKKTFSSKAEADAYDKHLDAAEAFYKILETSSIIEDATQTKALSIYLAENKDTLLEILGTKKKARSNTKKSHSKNLNKSAQLDLTEATPPKILEDLVIEPDEESFYQEEETTVIFDQEDVSDFTESDAA